MYADRETSPRTSEIIKKHLEECPECRSYYEHTSHVVRSMKQPPRGNHYRYFIRIYCRNGSKIQA